MGFFQKRIEKSLSKQIRNDPTAQAYLKQIEGYGRYDSSAQGQRNADRCFEIVERQIGCLNKSTRTIYQEACRQTNLPLPLCACYAFAIGEYVKNPRYTPINLNTEQARQNIMSIKLFFPDYRSFVESRHWGTEQDIVFGLTGNLLDYFM